MCGVRCVCVCVCVCVGCGVWGSGKWGVKTSNTIVVSSAYSTGVILLGLLDPTQEGPPEAVDGLPMHD